MPNIAAVLKSEVVRLCRREMRKDFAALKKVSATQRRDIAALKRKIVGLERQATSLAKQSSRATALPSAPSLDRPIRFVAKGLRSLRNRLGLSAKQLALLLGVSEPSVYNWETKKATPRKEQLAAIIAMRSIGKREAQQRLESIQMPKRARRRKTAK